MTKRLAIKLNEESSNKLEQLYEYVKTKSYLFDDKVKSKNGFANQLLDDYLSLLNETWQEHPKMLYSTFKGKFIGHRADKTTNEIMALERNNRDLMNMILYLLMDTNQVFIRHDMQSYEKLHSMFKPGTNENNMYAVLADLVHRDNQQLFKELHQQGRNLL